MFCEVATTKLALLDTLAGELIPTEKEKFLRVELRGAAPAFALGVSLSGTNEAV